MVKGYFAYMLRLWQADVGKRPTWRASLEKVSTGERQTFASLGDLLVYLIESVGRGADTAREAQREDSVPGDMNGAEARHKARD